MSSSRSDRSRRASAENQPAALHRARLARPRSGGLLRVIRPGVDGYEGQAPSMARRASFLMAARRGKEREVPMATNAAGQAACARQLTVPAVPILASKITTPDEPGWAVPRPRITTLIAQGTRWCPLTVLTAPAGAGKTTALALWSATEPGPVAW